MASLLFRGFNAEGQRVSGSKNLSSESQMKDYLDKQGITNYEIFESKTMHKQGVGSSISLKELSIFCKQISVLFHSNITLMEGILILKDQTDNEQLKIALTEIYGFMEKGYTFAEAFSMYDHIFSNYLLNMIIIGENSGTLDEVFSRMSSYFEKEHRIRKKVKSAVTYPAILTALMAAIIVLLIVKILPMFGDILGSMGAQMPVATRMIFNAGSFLAAFSPIAILIIAAAIVGFILYKRTDNGRYQLDKAKFSIPAYKYIHSRVITSRFSRSLAILLKSGVQLLSALEDITMLMDNKYLEDKLKVAVDEIRGGGDLESVLGKIGVFPLLFLKMCAIGQKTGNLDEMLDKSASVFDEEIDDALERFASMLEPVLIIILSVIVGVILLSVMLPMITIMNAIG